MSSIHIVEIFLKNNKWIALNGTGLGTSSRHMLIYSEGPEGPY